GRNPVARSFCPWLWGRACHPDPWSCGVSEFPCKKTARTHGSSGNPEVPPLKAAPLTPELFERPLAAINRVRAWRRGRGDSAQGAVVLAFFRMTLIIATAGRIGAHHQQVVGGRNALVARARRLHNHIA